MQEHGTTESELIKKSALSRVDASCFRTTKGMSISIIITVNETVANHANGELKSFKR